MVVFTILFLWSCRQESLYEDNQNDNNQKVHNKISLNTFKQETKVSKIEEFTVLKNSKSNGKDAGATSTFIIDSTSIYKLAVNNNLTTYSFRAYNIYETPDKVYNVVYRKTAGKVAYSIIEFLQDKTIKPIYDSEKGTLTETKPSTSSRICLDHWSVDVWHCKNGKTWEDCDKCFKCFEHYSGYSSYDCGGETGGSDTGSVDPSDPVEYDPNLPPPYYIPTDPSGYVFDPNEPPSIDEYYVRASRANTFREQLDMGEKIWAEYNPEIYNFILENYLNHYSTTNNTNNLQFANWAINFFMQNTNITWTQFQKWFLDGYSIQYQSNLTKLSPSQLLDFVNINKEIDASPYQEEFVKETNEMFIALSANGYLENPSNTTLENSLNTLCCPSKIISPTLSLHYIIQKEMNKISANYSALRNIHKDWNKAKCFWEASRDTIQLLLDIGGTVPLIGEVCDITNGIIYTMNGDGYNAALSYAGAIPFAGWFATGAKLGVKVVNKTASDIASRQVLKWVVGTDGKIYFGVNNITQARYQLRKVLMLTDGSKHAHHIIPVEVAQYAIVQKAAKSKEAFHINEAINGIPLPDTAHLTGHTVYNDKIKDVLNFLNKDNPNVEVAYQRLIGFNNYLRNLIKNNPNLNLGQIANLIKYP